jgi:hypothetical protein
VESLARQLQNSEKEIHRSAQQLQNAIAMATEEAAKSRAAKEVIKSLTAQVEFTAIFQVLKCNYSLQVGVGSYCGIRLQPRTGV